MPLLLEKWVESKYWKIGRLGMVPGTTDRAMNILYLFIKE